MIPVSTLSVGNAGANAYPGFTSPATTVSTSGGLKYLSPNPDNSLLVATTTLVERDSQVVTYPGGRGAILLRLSGTPRSQTALYFVYNQAASAGGDIRVGIVTGFDETQAYDSNPGTNYPYYVNTSVATSAEGIAAGFTNSYANGNEFTFGVSGFTVFLQWNGVDLIRYTEWRVGLAGRSAVWTHPGYGSRDITVSYPVPVSLFSNPSANIYDPRDFGMRNVPAVTGSMASSSNQLVLATAAGFQVGDPVIVEIGGESGAGLRNSVGVGGTWPTLSYANLAALNADTGKPDNTWAYLLSNGFVYVSQTGAWTHRNDGGGTYNQSYYQEFVLPQPLLAQVLAVSPDGKTLTLSASSTVATTSANVWLDCSPSFFVINEAARTETAFPPAPSTIKINVPAGSWALSAIVTRINTGLSLPASGYQIVGAGRTLTTLFSPKGTVSGAINLLSAPNNCVISDMKYQGNHGPNGFGFKIGTASPGNQFNGNPSAFSIQSDAAVSTGLKLQRLDGIDTYGSCCNMIGNGSVLDNCTVTMTTQQFGYNGWQLQLADQAGGTISNCTATGAFLLKSYEFFACNGASITNSGGTNCLYSTNSSTSWTIDTPNVTIAAGSYINELSGSKNEAIFNVNQNAFGSGNTGLINNPRVIQSGYINASDDSLKVIQISSGQTHVTIQGQYPGSGCSSSLGGYFQAPDYNALSGEYGAMAVYSDAPNTIVSGIRCVGAAIGSPGLSSHYGNISLAGATSSVTNCVADVIQPGPTLSGNQTNAVYCP